MPLSLHHSTFSHSFSTLLYSTSSFNLKNVKFSNSLSTAIIISKDTFQKQTYKKRQELSDDSNRFENCVFYQISGSKSDGGALYLDSAEASLKIIQCTFCQCSTQKNGGAIYAKCKKVTFETTCLMDCSASKEGGSYYLSKATTLDLKDILVEKATGQTALLFKSITTLEMQHLNMSSCSGEDSAFSLTDYASNDCNLKFNHFQSNSGEMILTVSSTGEVQFRQSNFISNSGEKALFSSDSKVFIIESYLQKDKSRYFVESSKQIILRDCFFQLTQDECNSKIGTNGLLVRGEFGSNQTMKIKMAFDDCPSVSSSSTKLKTGVIIAIVAAGILILIFLYIILRKYCCFKFADDDPLIRKYTP